jgi:hypothetical protein
VIRQAIAAAALVLCERAALWAGAELVVAEELEPNFFSCFLFGLFVLLFGYLFGHFSY